MASSQGKQYPKRLPGKALRFLCNYWIVVLLFSLLGLIFDKSGQIPGSLSRFLGNMAVVGMCYNGAWWFVVTYLILLVLSPILAAITRHINGIVLLTVSCGFYFVFYMLRFNYPIHFDNPVPNWIWQQLVLLGTSQFGYLLGMVVRRYELVRKLRDFLTTRQVLRRMLVLAFPLAAFIGHSLIQSLFVAPFTAAAVLISLFLAKLPGWARTIFLMLGKHSTNIWLVHMFFYLQLFTGFAFWGCYPVFVLALMLCACFLSSLVIDSIYRPVLSWLDRRQQKAEV